MPSDENRGAMQKSFNKFSLQLDELTDISGHAQLRVGGATKCTNFKGAMTEKWLGNTGLEALKRTWTLNSSLPVKK